MGKTTDIRAAVEAELTFDPLVDDADVDVANMNGDVALNGTVPSYPQYLEAAATQRVVGVKNASAIPLTPGALGVMEVTLAAITVGFRAPRATAGLAVLGCRVVNYWLPLLPGALVCLRLRLSLKAADAGEPSTPRPGE